MVVVTTEAKLHGARSRRGGGRRGPWLFEMPYTATAQQLTNDDLDLPNLVARAGVGAGYSIDVTLLDAPDHRLIRSGMVLAHRVIDGVGEWYLSGPSWVSQLAGEQIEPMGQTDLPERFADLICPFRRNSTLGPVAALTCERSEFAFRDHQGTTVAVLRDDRVTVRRGGLTTARYREVTLSPVGPGLTDRQRDWLQAALVAAGGTRVVEFPGLASRLGAPATGLTDFPEPQTWHSGASFESFVSMLLETRIREIVQADLSVRCGRAKAADRLTERVLTLRSELRGISAVLDPDWIEEVDTELQWLGEAGSARASHDILTRMGLEEAGPEEKRPDRDASVEALLLRLRSERYLRVLDRLVTAARAPRLGDSSTMPASEVTATLMDNAVARFARAAKRLSVEGSQQSWEAAAWAGRQLQDACAAGAVAFPRRARKISSRTDELIKKMDVGSRQPESLTAAAAAGADSAVTMAAAFELGRRYERSLRQQLAAREYVVRRWPSQAKKLQR